MRDLNEPKTNTNPTALSKLNLRLVKDRGADEAIPSHLNEKTLETSTHIQPLTPEKKWLNEDGSTKTDDELRECSDQWKPDDWEAYLSSTEGYQREESLAWGAAAERLTTEDYVAALVDIFKYNRYPHLEEKLREIMRDLTKRQREIVLMRHWQGKTLKDIAQHFGISFQSVHKTLAAAHKKIGTKLRMIAARDGVTQGFFKK